ncbi:MAG: hypothetical protein KTR30_31265 [Saprospiraceae bacterium]|nr:hypothetical protein [Saprospiraceae bacterium]
MKLNRSDITAFLALFVSLGALFVSIVEANIMREQQKIMQSQQKAAVYPHLSQHIDLAFSGSTPYNYTIENKGIGPAKIRTASFLLNGKTLAGYEEVIKELKSLFPPETGLLVSFFDPSGYFISPKETITVLKLTLVRPEELQDEPPLIDFVADFCYCSIFEDCWLQDGDEILEACP